MGYPTKVQLIQRKASQQWYVNLPSAQAQALQFSRGETVEWLVEDRSQLVLNRPHPLPSALKKKTPHRGSSTPSKPWSAKRSKGAANAVSKTRSKP